LSLVLLAPPESDSFKEDYIYCKMLPIYYIQDVLVLCAEVKKELFPYTASGIIYLRGNPEKGNEVPLGY
jgi:hypothetical protein